MFPVSGRKDKRTVPLSCQKNRPPDFSAATSAVKMISAHSGVAGSSGWVPHPMLQIPVRELFRILVLSRKTGI